MDAAHHNFSVHAGVGDPAGGFGSFLRVLVSQLKLGSDRGVAASIDFEIAQVKCQTGK